MLRRIDWNKKAEEAEEDDEDSMFSLNKCVLVWQVRPNRRADARWIHQSPLGYPSDTPIAARIP
eukprot:1133080-Pyramimonas_sp.AAC.1